MDRDGDYIGTHLVMDITSYNRELLKDQGKVADYLADLIKLADMTCLVNPQTFTFPYANEYMNFLEKLREEGTISPLIQERLDILDYNKKEGSGVTGFAVLCESHAAIHTFPEKKEPFTSVCLYSCKEYDTEKIINYTNEYWHVKSNNVVIMRRYVGKSQEINQLHYHL